MFISDCKKNNRHYSPEIHARRSLIKVRLIDSSNATFREENADKRWIVSFRPVLNRKSQWVCVMLWWIGEFQITMHGQLYVHTKELLVTKKKSFAISLPLCN